MSDSDTIIRPAATSEDLDAVRRLFTAYAQSLDFSLCFQGFDEELASLPGKYAATRQGALLLGLVGADAVGVVGLRGLEPGIAEMKRLYLTQQARGLGLGRKLCEALVAAAKRGGYSRMRLDTVPGKMDSAITLYRALGFRVIPPYNQSPIPGIIHTARTPSSR